MDRSLRSYLPDITRILRENEVAIYERQRALAREGLLESRPGHGRGSGVTGTPRNMAMLLIGLLASVTLSEAGNRARTIATAFGKCSVTGATNFSDALTALLTDADLARRVDEIVVGTTLAQAFIRYTGSSKSAVFVGEQLHPPAIQFTAHLPGKILAEIADLFASSGEVVAQ